MPEFIFHGELRRFLAPARRGGTVRHGVAPHQSAKHAIEALGVPHTEIGRLLVNGQAALLDCRLAPHDRIEVFPTEPPARIDPGGLPRFIADAHLGRLARHLRFAGIDTLWANAWKDAELVAIAGREGRIALTCDRALLMHRALHAGCHVRSRQPLAQLAEVARRHALRLDAGRTSRCLECNGLPEPVAKPLVAALVPPRSLAAFSEFWRCPDCRRIYWRGTHWQRMHAVAAAVDRALAGNFSAEPAPR
jgi:hypothetical protein